VLLRGIIRASASLSIEACTILASAMGGGTAVAANIGAGFQHICAVTDLAIDTLARRPMR
jgi:hypothetical protein